MRSCYKWLQGAQDSVYSDFWNKLWSLKVPGKVKNFIWRVCAGCLPTMEALARKCVNVNLQCPWCHSAPESDTHVLFTCDFAKTVWLGTGLHHLVQVLPQDTTFLVLRNLFSACTRNQCVLVCMICWSIWNRRNKWNWDRANESVFGVRAAATNLLHDWQEAQVVGRNTSSQGAGGIRKWQKPPLGWMTVNVDVVVFQDGPLVLVV